MSMIGTKWRGAFLALLVALPPAGASAGEAAKPWVVRPESIKSDLDFLAGDALRGRGSATPDEAAAAAYVASRFQKLGLVRAPGMTGYLQTATIVQPELGGAAVLTLGGKPVTGLKLLTAPPGEVRGRLVVAASDDPAALPAGDVIAIQSRTAPFIAMVRAASERGVKLLLVRETEETESVREQMGEPRMRPYMEGGTPTGIAIATLPDDSFDRLAGRAGKEATLSLPGMKTTRITTTNAVGFLPGTDAKAGVLLLTAHLDHLGQRPDGTILHGANDDASGVAAVLELARALADGPRNRRGILFVCYGAEEIGGFGSAYFAAHPPVPLSSIVANIEFEMIGARDPNMAGGALMMTGFERSDLGEALAAHGALVAADPYPDQNFFRRSDNYQLALKGVVAHTISAWPLTPVYHEPTDTVANLDLPFMAQAIQSLVEPVRWLAGSDFQPQWKSGGSPSR
jgi:Iap family predicted aminopeptidase